MNLDRRVFLQSGVVLSAAGPAAPSPTAKPDWAQVRKQFPWLERKVWLSGADYHPIGIHSLLAMERYLAYRVHGPGENRSRFTNEEQRETKELFGRLINAKPAEIAFVGSTTDAENLVVAGIGLSNSKGNVVIDDLHYQASKFLYRMLQKEGKIELRIVNHKRDPYWRLDLDAMEKAIDRNTRLVSLALVSNINGYLHDVKATSDLAHSRGALVYADIIQAAGAVPVDVRAMGIDCAGCGAYKWLMADMGFGFLYVREDLQENVVKRSRYGVRQYSSPNGAQADSQFTLLPGSARYELAGSMPNCGGVCVHAALRFIHSLGIDNIRAHAKELTGRLQKEIPRLGYAPITPPENPTSIVSFLTPNYKETSEKLSKAFGETVVAMRRWEFTEPSGKIQLRHGMRISPSVYNNHADIDLLLNALS
jgi:selenocysteine lyase/cysteine desulfurase